MTMRGVYVALTAEDERELLDAVASPERLIELVEETLEERVDEAWQCHLDKSWFSIALATGEIEPFGKDDLADEVVPSWFIGHAPSDYVAASAKALAAIDEAQLRELYFAIDGSEHDFVPTEDDYAYTRDYFERLTAFLAKTADAGRAAVFSVDYGL